MFKDYLKFLNDICMHYDRGNHKEEDKYFKKKYEKVCKETTIDKPIIEPLLYQLDKNSKCILNVIV